MGKYNVSEELINRVEILLHKESSTVNHSNHVPPSPSPSIIQDAITAVGSNSEDALRCKGCNGELLRGSDSIICIFCGRFPDDSVTVRDPIRFTDTLGFRLFLGSLSLDGSESVERPIKGGNESGRGRSTVKNEIPLSALLDLQLKWPIESNKFGVENDADEQSAKFVGINFDELLQTDGSREGASSSLNEQNAVNKNIKIKKDTTFAGQGSLSLFENSQIGPREGENDESDWATEFQSANTDAQVDSGFPINSIHQPLKQEESAKIAGFQALPSAVESKFEPSFESNQSGSNMTAKDGQMGLGTVDASFDWLPASEKHGITDKIDPIHQPLKHEESANIADIQALPNVVESKFEPSFESNQSGSNVAVTDGQMGLGTVDASFDWLPAGDKQGTSDQIDPPFNDKLDDESINNLEEFGVFSGAENNQVAPPTGGGFEIPDTWNGFTSLVEAGSNRLQTNLGLEKPVYGVGDDFALFGHASIEQKDSHVESMLNMTTNQREALGVQDTSKEVDDSIDFWNDYKSSDNGHNNQQSTTKEAPVNKVSPAVDDTSNVENDNSFDEWSDFAQSTGVLNNKPISGDIAFGALDDFSSVMVTPNPLPIGETKLAENQQFTTKEAPVDKVSPAVDDTSNVENDDSFDKWSDFAQPTGVLNNKPISGDIAFGALGDFSSIMVTPNPPQIGETKLAENQLFTTKELPVDKVSPAGDGTSNVENDDSFDEWSDFAESTVVLNSNPISGDIVFEALDDFSTIMVTPNPPQIGETKSAENQTAIPGEDDFGSWSDFRNSSKQPGSVFPELNLNGLKQDGIGTGRDVDTLSSAEDNKSHNSWGDLGCSTPVLEQPSHAVELKSSESKLTSGDRDLFLGFDYSNIQSSLTNNQLKSNEWSDFAQSTGVLNSKPISGDIAFGALDDFSSIMVTPNPPQIDETKPAENQTAVPDEDDFGSWSDFRSSSKQPDSRLPELNLNGSKQDSIGSGRDVDNLSSAEDKKSDNSWGDLGWSTPILEQPSHAVESKPSESILTSKDRDLFLGFDYSTTQPSLANNQFNTNGSTIQNGKSTSVNDEDDDDTWTDFVSTSNKQPNNCPGNNVETNLIQEPVIHDPFGEWNIIGSSPNQESGNVTGVTNEKFPQINVFSNNADSQFVGSKSSMPLDPFLFMLNDQNSSSHVASADTKVPNLFGTEHQEGIADNVDNNSETGFMEQHDQKSDVVESSLSIPKPVIPSSGGEFEIPDSSNGFTGSVGAEPNFALFGPASIEQQDTHVESMLNMTTNLSESLGLQGTSKEVNDFLYFWNDYEISDNGINSQQQFTKEAPVDKVSPAGDGKSNVKNDDSSDEWSDFAQSTGVLSSKPISSSIAFGALDDFSSKIDETKSAENQTAMPDEDDFGSWSDFRSSWKQPDSSFPELNLNGSKQDSSGTGKDVDNLSSAEDKKSDNSWGDLGWSTPILEQPSHAVEAKPSESILASKDRDLFLGFDYSNTQPSLPNNQFNSNGSTVQNGKSTSVNDEDEDDDDTWTDFVSTSNQKPNNWPGNTVKTDVIKAPVIHDPFGDWNIIGSAPNQESDNVTAPNPQINLFSKNADSLFIGPGSSMPQDPFLFMLNDQNGSSQVASTGIEVPNLFGMEHQDAIPVDFANKSETAFME